MKMRWLAMTLGITLSIGSSLSLAQVGGGDLSLEGGDAGPVVFSHDRHVADVGLKCQECHVKLYVDAKHHVRVTMAEMEKGRSCGACHNGKSAFSVKGDCDKCHGK